MKYENLQKSSKKWSNAQVSILLTGNCIHMEQKQKMSHNILLLNASVNREIKKIRRLTDLIRCELLFMKEGDGQRSCNKICGIIRM